MSTAVGLYDFCSFLSFFPHIFGKSFEEARAEGKGTVCLNDLTVMNLVSQSSRLSLLTCCHSSLSVFLAKPFVASLASAVNHCISLKHL